MRKVMIVGCGAIAPAHIEGFLNFREEAEIVVLAAPNIEKAQKLIDDYQLSARAVADYRTALSLVDVVAVCTPPALHREVAVNALNAGCHVLLEKPMALSLQECDEILEAAKRNDRLLSVVVQSRFISDVKNVIDMVKSEKYGKNYYTRVNSQWYRGQSYYELYWRGRWSVEGGGCTLNHSIHHIDLLLWAKGMPKQLTSTVLNLNHSNSQEEDFSSSLLQYADGSVAEITSSLLSHGEPQTLSFQMEEAGLSIPFQAAVSKTRENGFPMEDAEKKAQVEEDFHSRPILAYENHGGQIRNFLRAVAGQEQLVATGADGRNNIELILGIYKSAFSKQVVTFPIHENDPYYGNEWREHAVHFNEKKKDVAGFSDTTITDFKEKYK